MRLLVDFVMKNAWNLIGVVGVLGTFYFSLFHIPVYVQGAISSKGNVAHESLMDDVQELLFYDKALSIEDVRSFIQAKELKQGITYTFTPDELLAQVQERFMGNKFIPLDKREALLKRIKSIRANYKAPPDEKGMIFDWALLGASLASGLGILVSLFGATSITRKIKIDKETEADFAADEIVINNFSGVGNAAFNLYEKMVGGVLEELGALKAAQPHTRDFGGDFVAAKYGQEYIVEVKYYRKMLGMGTARDFLYTVLKSGKNGILIVSSGATRRTLELFLDHNKLSATSKVFLVTGTSASDIKAQLQGIFEESSAKE